MLYNVTLVSALHEVNQLCLCSVTKSCLTLCNLMDCKKWYRWPYLQDSNRDTDVENGPVDTVDNWEGGMNGRLRLTCTHYHGLPEWLGGKESPAKQETQEIQV